MTNRLTSRELWGSIRNEIKGRLSMPIRRLTVQAVGTVVLALALSSCASNGDISVLKSIKSETLPQRTFAWAHGSVLGMVPEEFGEGRATALSKAITTSLADKGYVLVDGPKKADLIVAVAIDGDFKKEVGVSRSYGNLANTPAVNTPYARRAPAAHRRRTADRIDAVYGGRPTGKVVKAEVEATLIIDIRDRSTEDDLWKGRIRKTIALADVKQFEGEIDDDVAELFEDFPASNGD